jgi:hypothetical protein
LFLNDDSVVYLNEEDVEDFTNLDLVVCEELGLLPKYEKSFLSNSTSVFCENYLFWGDFLSKETYHRREYNLCLNAVNICHAK